MVFIDHLIEIRCGNVLCSEKYSSESQNMKLIIMILATLMVAAGAYGEDVGSNIEIQATTYADGVLLEVSERDVGLKVIVSGPGKTLFEIKQSAANPVFVDIHHADNGPLSDGLYKYEAWPIPAIIISRAESSSMPDRNTLHGKTDPKISPFSGTFRIVNGTVIDPNIEEFDASTPGEDPK